MSRAEIVIVVVFVGLIVGAVVAYDVVGVLTGWSSRG